MSPRFAFTPLPPARSDASRRPSAIAALAGTWRGQFIDDDGTTESFMLLRDSTPDSAVAGRFLFFSTPTVAPTGVRLLDANERTFVALVGPYFDPAEGAEVITVLEGVRTGKTIEGRYHTRLTTWREDSRVGRFTATWADQTNKAA